MPPQKPSRFDKYLQKPLTFIKIGSAKFQFGIDQINESRKLITVQPLGGCELLALVHIMWKIALESGKKVQAIHSQMQVTINPL